MEPFNDLFRTRIICQDIRAATGIKSEMLLSIMCDFQHSHFCVCVCMRVSVCVWMCERERAKGSVA